MGVDSPDRDSYFKIVADFYGLSGKLGPLQVTAIRDSSGLVTITALAPGSMQ